MTVGLLVTMLVVTAVILFIFSMVRGSQKRQNEGLLYLLLSVFAVGAVIGVQVGSAFW